MNKTLKTIFKIIGIVLAAAVIIGVATFANSVKKIQQSFKLTPDEKLIASVPERKTVTNLITGSGTISYEDAINLTVPGKVEIPAYAVKNGDTVNEGDLIAHINRTDVMLAIQELQALIEKLDSEINSVEKTNNPTWNYKAMAEGTVKSLYVEEGDNVLDVMYEHGCLGVIETNDGFELKMLGFTGKVGSLYVAEGQRVTEDRSLFALTAADYNGEQNQLLETRATLEEQLLELFNIYKDNGVYAKTTGIITDIPDDSEYMPYIIEQAAADNFGVSQSQLKFVEMKLKKIEGMEGLYIDNTDPEVMKVVGPGDVPLSAFAAAVVDSTGKPMDISSLDENSTILVCYTVNNSGNNDPSLTIQTVTGFGGGASMGNQTSASTSSEDTSESKYKFDETTVCTFTPASKALIDISIDELDILSVSEGQGAEITLDALKGKSFAGTVSKINRSGVNSGGTSKFTVTVEMDHTEEMISGMNAGVSIVVKEVKDALCVPTEAIFEKDGKSYLYTAYDEKTDTLLNPIEVSTGVSDGLITEISWAMPDTTPFFYKYASDYAFR